METVSDHLRRLWEPRFNRNQKTCNIQESQGYNETAMIYAELESGGLWNLLGFIETKPLIRGDGLGQRIPALTAMKQQIYKYINI